MDKNGLQQPQGALVAIEPQTGQIRAMVGGRGKISSTGRSWQKTTGLGNEALYLYCGHGTRIFSATVMVDEPVEYVLPSGENGLPRIP